MTGTNFLVIIALTVIPHVVQADNALIGTSGLLTVPTAETTQDGRFAWGIGWPGALWAASGEWTVGWYVPPGHYTHFLDSRVYGGKRHATFAILPMWVTLGYLPFLETTVRLTLIPDAPPPAADIGIYKDGMAAMQFRLFGERGRWPAIGLGIRDFYGFGLFPASYIVVTKTKQIGSERVRLHGGWGFPWPSRVVGPSGEWTVGWNGALWSHPGQSQRCIASWDRSGAPTGWCGLAFG